MMMMMMMMMMMRRRMRMRMMIGDGDGEEEEEEAPSSRYHPRIPYVVWDVLTTSGPFLSEATSYVLGMGFSTGRKRIVVIILIVL